jgi:hypothetical protein
VTTVITKPFAGALLAVLMMGMQQVSHASLIVTSAVLSGVTEIPSNASPGTGFAEVTFDDVLLTMEVHASFTGLIGTTTASHIHAATATPGSANVGVATNLPSFTGFPLAVTSGTYDHIFDMSLASSYNPAFITAQGGISNAFSTLIAASSTGNAYFNIHTTQFPGGEIRGLLFAVPEPATLALVAIALAGVGFSGRKRASK